MTKRLTFGLALSPLWVSGQSWRRADSRVEEMYGLDFTVEAARVGEAGDVDFLFLPDALTLRRDDLAHSPGFSGPDSMIVMAALAGATSRATLIPTVSGTLHHPFLVARQLQSLNTLTKGRMGWNVVTSLGGSENFQRNAPVDDPYQRAGEFVDMVRRLWATFPQSALEWNRGSGQCIDPARLSLLSGDDAWGIAGPLGVPASHAEGPLLTAGASQAAYDFAARHADGMFLAHPEVDQGIAVRKALREASERAGRQTTVRALPGLSMFIDDTRVGARTLAESAGLAARHWTVVGTPDEVVDAVLARAEVGALDGFVALPGGSWRSLSLFCTEVMPALRRIWS